MSFRLMIKIVPSLACSQKAMVDLVEGMDHSGDLPLALRLMQLGVRWIIGNSPQINYLDVRSPELNFEDETPEISAQQVAKEDTSGGDCITSSAGDRHQSAEGSSISKEEVASSPDVERLNPTTPRDAAARGSIAEETDGSASREVEHRCAKFRRVFPTAYDYSHHPDLSTDLIHGRQRRY